MASEVKYTTDGLPIRPIILEEIVYLRDCFRAIGEYEIADSMRDYLERNGVIIMDGISVSYGNFIN